MQNELEDTIEVMERFGLYNVDSNKTKYCKGCTKETLYQKSKLGKYKPDLTHVKDPIIQEKRFMDRNLNNFSLYS